MSPAGRARIGAYVAAAGEPGRGRETAWREALERANAALAGGDAREARRRWEEAYQVAVHTRTLEGLLAVGEASLRVGEATRSR
jgi:hypothetical protein